MEQKRHRWVTDEPDIPFSLHILYEDQGIIVVDKPHFLATTPRGMWYRQTALIRVREHYGEQTIVPAHRLDRATAGVVVFVRDPALRGTFQTMFQDHRVTKTYECLAPLRPIRFHSPHPAGVTRPLAPPRIFPVERLSHITKLRSHIQAFEEPDSVNARTVIDIKSDQSVMCGGQRVPATQFGLRAYVLRPLTGKTHQLRVHMNALGLPIEGDDIYPVLMERPYDDFSSPLQLVARALEFTDPRNGMFRHFESLTPLGWEQARAPFREARRHAQTRR